jgi:hypothetical protein
MRSMLPRKVASVLVRAPVIAPVPLNLDRHWFRRKPEAGSNVHDMF